MGSTSQGSNLNDNPSPILYVFVVGFHHKRGCQVEYCYPPIRENGDTSVSDSDIPEKWHPLPSLALPDGAHNVEKDTVFFLLPSLEHTNQSVYGVSCYRQIDAKDLISKDSEVTRSSVQKSVCVLSTLPLFGLLKAKLELITQAYFNERNFAKVEVLAEMYRNLCSTVTQDLIKTQALIGIPVRDKIKMSRHRILVLFKLFLLEKRVLFYLFPVQDLCLNILAILSLFPEMIEGGLNEASFYVPKSMLLTTSDDNHKVQNETTETDITSKEKAEESDNESQNPAVEEADEGLLAEIQAVLENNEKTRNQKDLTLELNNCSESADNNSTPKEDYAAQDLPSPTQRFISASVEKLGRLGSKIGNIGDIYWGSTEEGPESDNVSGSDQLPPGSEAKKGRSSKRTNKRTDGGSAEIATEANETYSTEEMKSYSSLKTDTWGFPLSIFTKGSLCHPYLSLAYLDWLKADCIRSYVFGATNALYRQRRDLWDVMVTVDEAGELQIEIQHPELKRQLALTTADLRFTEYLNKYITPDTGNVFVDATGWEGGDEWIRMQFRHYLLALIATLKTSEPNLTEDFNETFVQAWKTTHNYRILSCGHYPDLKNVPPGHTFAGQFNVTDVKVRLNTMMTTQPGKKITSAVSQIHQTGKNVKSAFSSWWSEGSPKESKNALQLQSPQEETN